jgi:hypothetical protein
MKTEIKEIKKAAITETYEGETVFIEIEEEIKGDKRTAAINAPLPDTIDGSYRIKFEDFKENVPFEAFVDDVENQIKNDINDEVGLSVSSIFHSLANMYSHCESFGKIVIDLSEDFGWECDYKKIVENYDSFYIWNNDALVTKTDNVIRYSKPLFSATFLKNGELVEFSQPNVKKEKEMNEKEKNKVIEEVKKELFN